MVNLAFEQRKWPKKHAYLVEEFDPLNVRDVLGCMSAYHADNRLPWNPPTHPDLTVVPRKRHPERWYFLCPVCGRRCEDLFPPYLGATKDLKCRICSDLIYASQRYGKRHPLRKELTPRKRITAQRRHARYEKASAKHQKKTQKIIQEIRSEPYPDYDFDAIREALESAIGAKNLEVVKESEPSIRSLPGFSQEESEALFEEVKATMMDLAENAESKKARKMAQKELRDRGWGFEEPEEEDTV